MTASASDAHDGGELTSGAPLRVERFRLARLPRPLRVVVALLLLVAFAAAAFLVGRAAGYQPGLEAICVLVLVATALALAVLALAGGESSARSWWLGRAWLSLLPIGLAGVLAAPQPGSGLLRPLALTAGAVAFLFALLPPAILVRAPPIARLVGAVLPPLCLLAGLFTVAGEPRELRVGEVVLAFSLLALAPGAFIIAWQAIEGVRALPQLAAPVLSGPRASLHRLLGPVLLIVLGGKLVFLVLAYADVGFPGELAATSRANGALAWLVAWACALALVFLLASARRTLPVSDRATQVLPFAFALLFVGDFLLLIPLVAAWLAAGYLPSLEAVQETRESLFLAVDWWSAPAVARFWESGTVFLCALVALVLAALGQGRRTLTLLAGGVALWSLPLAFAVALGKGASGFPGVAAPVSLDTAFTVCLVAITLFALTGRGEREWALLLASLVVLSVVAYAGPVYEHLPGEVRESLFFLAFLLPLAWQFFIDAGELNEQAARRAARVVLPVLVAVFAVVAPLAELGIGGLSADSSSFADVTRAILAVPLAAFALAVLAPLLARGGGAGR